MGKKYDLNPGDKFNRLMITWERETRNRAIYEKCVCDCWNIKWVSRHHLMRWKIRSCWCLARELTKERNKKLYTKHWMFWTKFYSAYVGARERCNNPNNPSYKNYGWRWIKFLWNDFDEFYKDMYPSFKEHFKKYWTHDTSLDRVDVNWNYCKENCRRATYQEQQNNRRDCVEINYKWIKFPTIIAFAKYINKPSYIITQRLSRWWRPKEIVEVPVWMNRYQYYKKDKYKSMPTAHKIEYQWKVYPSIKDFCSVYWINYSSFSSKIHRWFDKKNALEKLLNKKSNTNESKVNFLS